uniref:hypothetical protein n=1 Tax=Streptomyces sp. NRRL F-2664 TaxID=1463842 RepID=UPI00131D4F8F
TGRFTTRDPHPTPLNKYQAYAANPIEYTDPTGNIQIRIRHHDPLDDQRRHPGTEKHNTAIPSAEEDLGGNTIPSLTMGQLLSFEQLLILNGSRLQEQRVRSRKEAVAHMKSFLFPTEISVNSIDETYGIIRGQALENSKINPAFKGPCKTSTCAFLASIQGGRIFLPAGRAVQSSHSTEILGARMELATGSSIQEIMIFARAKFRESRRKDYLVYMRHPGRHVAPITFRFDEYGIPTDDADRARGFLADTSRGVLTAITSNTGNLITYTDKKETRYDKYSKFTLYPAPDFRK